MANTSNVIAKGKAMQDQNVVCGMCGKTMVLDIKLKPPCYICDLKACGNVYPVSMVKAHKLMCAEGAGGLTLHQLHQVVWYGHAEASPELLYLMATVQQDVAKLCQY
jgi:hypothetical protein